MRRGGQGGGVLEDPKEGEAEDEASRGRDPSGDRVGAKVVEGAGVEEPAPADAVELRQRGDREKAAREGAPDPGQPVGGQGPDGVVEVLVDGEDAEDDDHPGDRSDDHRRPWLDVAGGCRDRDQCGDGAVADHADVHRLGHEVDAGERGDRARGGGQVGGDDDVGEVEVGRVQRRTRVEAEPAEPEDEDAELGDRHAVAGDRVRLPFPLVLADPGAEQEQPGKAGRGTGQVDDRGAGEILGSEGGLEPAAAEELVADERVDEARERYREEDVDDGLGPLQLRAPDERERERAEHERKEELGTRETAQSRRGREDPAATAE